MATATAITTFRNRHWLLIVFLLLGVGMIIQGVATAAYFLVFDDEPMPIFRVVILGLSAALFGFGLWFAAYARRRLADPEPAIVIGPAGLHDRAISERPIPWREIRNLTVWHGRGGPVVAFDLADGAAERAGVKRGAHVSAAVSRTLGHNYHIRSMGTDASVERLVAAISPYAPVDGG